MLGKQDEIQWIFKSSVVFSVCIVWIPQFITSVFIKQYCFLVVYIILLEEVTISPTIESQGGWATNWRPITPKKFLHCFDSSRAHNRLPILGIQQRDWQSPGNLTLKVSRVWLQNFQRTGETDSWRAQTKPCAHWDPGERSNDPSRDWARPACKYLEVSGGGMGWQRPATGLGHWQFWEVQHAGIRPFGEGCQYPYHSWALGQTIRREHSLTHQQKIGIKIYWAWLYLPEKEPVLPTAISSHQKASPCLYSLYIRGQTEWKP